MINLNVIFVKVRRKEKDTGSKKLNNCVVVSSMNRLENVVFVDFDG